MSLTTDPVLDLVTLALVAGTVFLAVYTAKLHGATVDLAKDTVAASDLADRHHQETLSPMCVVVDGRCTLVGTSTGKPADRKLHLSFAVENQGAGPAVRVIAEVAPEDALERPAGDPFSENVGPLKPGAKSKSYSPFRAAFPAANGYKIKLTFENVFGSVGVTEWRITYQSPTEPGLPKLVDVQLPASQKRI